MTRKDYPWHPSDAKRVESFLVMLFKLLLMVIQGGILGIVALSKFIGLIKTSTLSKKEEANPPIENRKWLAYVNDTEYDYERAFIEHGYAYINPKNRRINVGDTVYLYIASEKRVKYDTMVIEIDVKRRDNNYWRVVPPKGAACKLEKIGEYKGKALSLSKLKKNGFNGEKTIKLPICNNAELLDYIEDKFEDMYYGG